MALYDAIVRLYVNMLNIYVTSVLNFRLILIYFMQWIDLTTVNFAVLSVLCLLWFSFCLDHTEM